MASKRMLKKSVNDLTFDLVSECYTYRHFHPEQNDALNEIIEEVVKVRNELIGRINNAPKDEKTLTAYYNEVVNDMKAMVSKLDKIETLKK